MIKIRQVKIEVLEDTKEKQIASILKTLHIKRNELEKAVVYIPNIKDYQVVNEKMKPLIDLIIVNRTENVHLSAIRDMLLPKLLNGEIDVSGMKE